MKTLKLTAFIGESPLVNMGPIKLRQPLPNYGLENLDPFLLLHHYGPYAISEFNNPFDLGPHPHRGFEPITLLFKGEQFHRDSLGNEMVVKAGDVQWTTAGRGIVHAEAPTKEFVKKSGDLEGIQLWLNLPQSKKMMPANYQHLQKVRIPSVFSDDQLIEIKVVAGKLNGLKGIATTQTDVNIFTIYAQKDGVVNLDISNQHVAGIYLLDGEVEVNNNTLQFGKQQLITFHQEGELINLKVKKDSNLLLISGEPFQEPIVQYGPYVMNTQTEILEAMRDFQQGKMGYLY